MNVRAAYGVLQALTLVAALPHARRYFSTEKWSGYTESTRWLDVLLSPGGIVMLVAIWIASAIGLAVGLAVIPAAAINLAFSYFFFIRLRWRSVLRGMGAPGFISFWLAAAVFMLAISDGHAPGLRPLVLLTLQIDFALIMLSAGLYKVVAGYRTGDGMDLGLANPEWGYWTGWRTWPPGHWLFRLLNESAWATEACAGLLMLVPATRTLGAGIIALSFVFIAAEIRLGFLCEMVIVCCAVCMGFTGRIAEPGALLPTVAQQAIATLLVAYITVLPLARIGMYYNQLAHKRLPRVLQHALDWYTNACGLIIWRVFTADVTNFFVRIWEAPAGGAPRREITAYAGMTGFARFRQVAECIALTSIFTTLKYYPSNRALFETRLIRYARTIPVTAAARLVFEWVLVAKEADRFEFVPVAEFAVDPRTAVIDETVLSRTVSVRAAHAGSPVHEGARPGSYAPLGPGGR
jgi:hypothetical protein